MPYQTRNELPESVRKALRDVPHAQEIYKDAYNSAYATYDKPSERRDDRDREETAHAVAWSAVKQKYEKGEDGVWQLQD